MSIEQLSENSIYITEGTPLPLCCPNCKAIIPVASLDGNHSGVDRDALNQICWACCYEDETCNFECEWLLDYNQ